MTYVDGFVLAVPTVKRDVYVAMARKAAPVFRKHGAIRVVECWGDDVPEGKLTSFPMAVKLQADETVVFSWIEWPSRAMRDAGMAKVMQDPDLQMDPETMPYDAKRMIFGGFEEVVCD